MEHSTRFQTPPFAFSNKQGKYSHPLCFLFPFKSKNENCLREKQISKGTHVTKTQIKLKSIEEKTVFWHKNKGSNQRVWPNITDRTAIALQMGDQSKSWTVRVFGSCATMRSLNTSWARNVHKQDRLQPFK